MGKPGGRQISDAVHGIIELTELEVRILDARAFQRLRNVKQLGLAHYVFPGADYSRFSHSVGACHVMGRIMDVLKGYAPAFLDRDTIQMYRAAALLHDVGHYPFSHATEYALKNHYTARLITTVDGAKKDEGAVGEPYMMHESVTGLVITDDPEISKILKDGGIDPKIVEDTIRRQQPPSSKYLSNLISSDLDADRLDYLLRTAHHAGLPYGHVDLDYLLTQMRLDKERRVCLTPRAIRAADHMLLCRYFDYQQVTFHKAVQGLEWVLKGCVSDVANAKLLDGSKTAIEKMVREGTWADFDDGHLVNQIRRVRESGSADEKLRAVCVLDRKPPVVLAREEKILKTGDLKNKDKRKIFLTALKACAKKFEIPDTRIHLWEPSPLTLTKIGGHVDVIEIANATDKKKDDLEQAVRILDEVTNDSSPIQSEERSLMSVLSDHGVRPMRIYALLSDAELKNLDEMKACVQRELK